MISSELQMHHPIDENICGGSYNWKLLAWKPLPQEGNEVWEEDVNCSSHFVRWLSRGQREINEPYKEKYPTGTPENPTFGQAAQPGSWDLRDFWIQKFKLLFVLLKNCLKWDQSNRAGLSNFCTDEAGKFY